MTRADQALSVLTTEVLTTAEANGVAVIRGPDGHLCVVRRVGFETAMEELRAEQPRDGVDAAAKAYATLCQRAAFIGLDCATNRGACSRNWETVLKQAVDAGLVDETEAAAIRAGPYVTPSVTANSN